MIVDTRPMTASAGNLGNILLDVLDDAAIRELQPSLRLVHLEQGLLLAERGVQIREVWFPIDAVISSSSVMRDGRSVDVVVVGREGVVSGFDALGAGRGSCRAVVQVAGNAWRLEAAAFTRSLELHSALREGVCAYLRLLLAHSMQAAACQRFHGTEQRLSRWLLEIADRTGGTVYPVTHEVLAVALGAERPWVTKTILRLRRSGSIRYERGQLAIINRRALERSACECYHVARSLDPIP